MSNDRIAIYGLSFPNGFAHISKANNIDVAKEKAAFPIRKKSITRAAKQGENALRLTIDPNGCQFASGDILLELGIESATPRDYRITDAKERLEVCYGEGNSRWYQYVVVAPVSQDDADLIACRAASRNRRTKTMDWAMNS